MKRNMQKVKNYVQVFYVVNTTTADLRLGIGSEYNYEETNDRTQNQPPKTGSRAPVC